LYLIREYFNEDKTEILTSNGWTEVMEVPQTDRHESMGCNDDAEYWTVYRCRDLNGEWDWDCSLEMAERLDRQGRQQGKAESKKGPYIVRYPKDDLANSSTLQDALNGYARDGYQLVHIESLPYEQEGAPVFRVVFVENSSWLGQWD